MFMDYEELVKKRKQLVKLFDRILELEAFIEINEVDRAKLDNSKTMDAFMKATGEWYDLIEAVKKEETEGA